MHGTHLLKAYAKTQANIALSSGEAEYYSMVKAASEGLGLRAMTADYGDPLPPWMYVDATAAMGVAQRVGLGKLRHLDTQTLWLQQAVRQKRVGLSKVLGTSNPADLMTKYTDAATLERMIGIMGLQRRGGRAKVAPQMTQDEVNSVEYEDEKEFEIDGEAEVEVGIEVGETFIFNRLEADNVSCHHDNPDYIYSEHDLNLFFNATLNTFPEIDWNVHEQIGGHAEEHVLTMGRLPGGQSRRMNFPWFITGVKERRRQDRLYRWIRNPRAREGVEDEPDTERLRTPLNGRPCGRLLLSTRNEHGPRADAHRPLKDDEQGADDRKILRDCERCDSARRHVSSAQVSLAPPLQPPVKTMRPRIALATMSFGIFRRDI